mmetsp:Transcript_134402/g.233202  ORF Transcript_134402/g.233202 Transcript_134402/m.233202 type:complete len:227 (+) Transcript_134402:244-924(+)
MVGVDMLPVGADLLIRYFNNAGAKDVALAGKDGRLLRSWAQQEAVGGGSGGLQKVDILPVMDVHPPELVCNGPWDGAVGENQQHHEDHSKGPEVDPQGPLDVYIPLEVLRQRVGDVGAAGHAEGAHDPPGLGDPAQRHSDGDAGQGVTEHHGDLGEEHAARHADPLGLPLADDVDGGNAVVVDELERQQTHRPHPHCGGRLLQHRPHVPCPQLQRVVVDHRERRRP